MGKLEIWFAKSNDLQYSVWEGSENMGFDLRRCNFFGLLNLDILCSCSCYKFYSFMFIHKISIRVVCASDYDPRSHDLSRWWKKDTARVPSCYINVNRIINAIKDCFLFFLDLIQKVFLHYVFDKIFVNRCSAQVSDWSYANCFNNKVSKGSILSRFASV